jgi:hypothetical protein
MYIFSFVPLPGHDAVVVKIDETIDFEIGRAYNRAGTCKDAVAGAVLRVTLPSGNEPAVRTYCQTFISVLYWVLFSKINIPNLGDAFVNFPNRYFGQVWSIISFNLRALKQDETSHRVFKITICLLSLSLRADGTGQNIEAEHLSN